VDTLGQIRDLIRAGCPAGLVPTQLAQQLPDDTFRVIDDPELKRLNRELFLVIEKKAADTRDRLSELARRLAGELQRG